MLEFIASVYENCFNFKECAGGSTPGKIIIKFGLEGVLTTEHRLDLQLTDRIKPTDII